MPTYEYGCPKGHHFEKVQKISEKPVARCPECGAPATRKISGGAGLVFKGSGFYITDYGKDGKGPRKDPAEKPAGDSAAKAESKPADTKPATRESAPAKKAAE
jgi:putative FmdB family regulatory protein